MSRYLVAPDAGGTMGDVILIDAASPSPVGMARTAPRDPQASVGAIAEWSARVVR
jgi:hypothetical protein